MLNINGLTFNELSSCEFKKHVGILNYLSFLQYLGKKILTIAE